MDGRMDRQMDRMMDRQTKKWAYRPINGWTCNACAWICKKQSFSYRFCNFYESITDQRTDQRTNRQTDGRTSNLIEMRGNCDNEIFADRCFKNDEMVRKYNKFFEWIEKRDRQKSAIWRSGEYRNSMNACSASHIPACCLRILSFSHLPTQRLLEWDVKIVRRIFTWGYLSST